MSSGVASALDCPPDEGSVHPCRVAGTDIGDVLHRAFVIAWLMLLAAPAMFVAVLFWIVIAVRASRRRPDEPRPGKRSLHREFSRSVGQSDAGHEQRQQQGHHCDDEDPPEGHVKRLLQHRPHAGRCSGKGIGAIQQLPQLV